MSLPFREHPLRHQAVAELHARTYEPLRAPERVLHITAVCGERGTGRNLQHMLELLKHFGVEPPPRVDQHHRAVLGDIRMLWERHTEFCTYTFSRRGRFTDPFAAPLLLDLPPAWLASLPGDVVAAVSLAIEPNDAPERTPEELAALFGGNAVIGSEVVGGAARAWSDLRIHPDGLSRMLLRDQGLSDNQAGRLAKRLLEVSSYRAMALLGLPPARDASSRLSRADARLVAVAAEMSGEPRGEKDAEKTLLAELTALAAEIEAIAARTSYRFEASKAYYGVVVQRLEQLRQRRIEGLQTFTEFLDARLAPAIATCESAAKRQHDLAERAARITFRATRQHEVRLPTVNHGPRDQNGIQTARALPINRQAGDGHGQVSR